MRSNLPPQEEVAARRRFGAIVTAVAHTVRCCSNMAPKKRVSPAQNLDFQTAGAFGALARPVQSPPRRNRSHAKNVLICTCDIVVFFKNVC